MLTRRTRAWITPTMVAAVAAIATALPAPQPVVEPCHSGSLLICAIFPEAPQLDDDIDLTTDPHSPHGVNSPTERGDRG